MKTTVNMDDELYRRVCDFRDNGSLSMTMAVNKLLERGLSSLSCEARESSANDEIASKLNELQSSIERYAGDGQRVVDAAKSLQRAADDVREAKAKSALAAQAAMGALLASSVDAINLASVGGDEYLVYGAFREADLRATTRYFMAAGKAMAEDGKVRREVWPAFKGADKYADEECLAPVDVFFEGDGMRAEEAMDIATDVAGGKSRGKKAGGR